MIKRILSSGLLITVCILVLIISPLLGAKNISPMELLANDKAAEVAKTIFWQLRIPRVTLALTVGASLSVAGLCYQSMFRNPLATPYTLGVASGAAFGASIAIILLKIQSEVGLATAGFLGAMLSICLVYSLHRATKLKEQNSLLLSGIAISFFFSSLILFIQYTANFAESFQMLRWLMGGLETFGFLETLRILPLFLVCFLVLIFHTKELDLLILGDEFAQSRGVNISRLKKILFFTTSALVGVVVSVCGPIGFVGMIVPHLCRMTAGERNETLVPLCTLIGGCFLVACDTVARVIIAPAEIPVGVITALLGSPFFIFLLLRKRQN